MLIKVYGTWKNIFFHTLIFTETILFIYITRLPRWLSGKEFACQCRRREFDPQVEKIPWRRKQKSTLIVLPGKSHGQRSLEGYGVTKESDTI